MNLRNFLRATSLIFLIKRLLRPSRIVKGVAGLAVLTTLLTSVLPHGFDTISEQLNLPNPISSGTLLADLSTQAQAKVSDIPSYEGHPYTVLNQNKPEFASKYLNETRAFETYSSLDKKGRCGVAFANICEEIMPTQPRGDISSIHPSGWQKNMGWERCHLIGFQLAGENANEKNLITGTHYLNVTGMLPFENMIADYVKETKNHVLYRVTPLYKSDKELVARGVQMEAYSVEDHGEGIFFNVFCHNVKPGKDIDYKTGYVTTSSTPNITVKTTKKTYKKSVLAKKSCSFSMGIKTSCGSYTCKKSSGSSCLSVNTKGYVKVKKGTKVGTYTIKVKITAKNKGKTRSATKKVSVTVTDEDSDGSSSNQTVYWVDNGEVYHTSKNCSSLSNSRNIHEGTIAQSGKSRKCSRCP